MTERDFGMLVKRAIAGDEDAARSLRGYADRAHGPSGHTVRDARAVAQGPSVRRRRLSVADLRVKARHVASRR
jgi:hypothetical protein